MLELAAKGVVWDLDGTLLDSYGLQVNGLTEILKRRGMTVPSPEVFLHNYHGRLKDSLGAIAGVDGPLLDEIYEEFIRNEEHRYEKPDDLYFADAIDLLRRTHVIGLKQILVSNRPHFSDERLGSPRNLAKKPPLAGLIDVVVCGGDTEFHKPDARMLDVAERELGLNRKELVVLGDQFVDAELAHNLGVRGVLVARSGNDIPHLERLPDGWEDRITIVKNLGEVSIKLA